jgi:hypothetical protein
MLLTGDVITSRAVTPLGAAAELLLGRQVGFRHDAHGTAAVEHRHGTDPVVLQQLHEFLERAADVRGDHLTGHQRGDCRFTHDTLR